MTYLVDVMQRDIDQGQRSMTRACPVALAMKRSLGHRFISAHYPGPDLVDNHGLALAGPVGPRLDGEVRPRRARTALHVRSGGRPVTRLATAAARLAITVELYRARWHRQRATGGARCFRLVWGGAL